MPKGIKGFQKGHRLNIGNTYCKDRVPWNKGFGDYITGEKNPFWGKSHTEETKLKISKKNKGKKLSKEHIEKLVNSTKTKKYREKMSKIVKERYTNTAHPCKGKPAWNKGIKRWWKSPSFPKGNIPWNYKGGVSTENEAIRSSVEYKEWRRDVFVRDEFTCKKCGLKSIRIEAHHIKSFKNYPELRFIIGNGITNCKWCHDEKHNKKTKEARPY